MSGTNMQISVQPAQVSVGDTLTVTGTGALSDAQINIYSGIILAETVVSDQNGNFIAVFNLDLSLSGQVPIYAIDPFNEASNVVTVTVGTSPTPLAAKMLVSPDGGQSWSIAKGNVVVELAPLNSVLKFTKKPKH